jgi:hypothetical protein
MARQVNANSALHRMPVIPAAHWPAIAEPDSMPVELKLA